jgi:hypothetical protein
LRRRWMRRVFLQAFSSAQLRRLVPGVVGMARAYCQRWAATDGPVNLALEVKGFTFEVRSEPGGRPLLPVAMRVPPGIGLAEQQRALAMLAASAACSAGSKPLCGPGSAAGDRAAG